MLLIFDSVLAPPGGRSNFSFSDGSQPEPAAPHQTNACQQARNKVGTYSRILSLVGLNGVCFVLFVTQSSHPSLEALRRRQLPPLPARRPLPALLLPIGRVRATAPLSPRVDTAQTSSDNCFNLFHEPWLSVKKSQTNILSITRNNSTLCIAL